MIHPLAAGTVFYRVVDVSRSRWPEVLTARGAFFNANGGRFNHAGVQVAYVTDDPLVAAAEVASYAAEHQQTQLIPNGFWSRALRYPFTHTFRLWAFTLTVPTHVIDVEHPQAIGQFGHCRYLLMNPSHAYLATQQLASRVLTHQPAPQPGLRGPSVRGRHRQTGGSPSQLALFVAAVPPQAQPVQVWRLDIEFRDMNGQPITPQTDRVDWETAYCSLHPVQKPLAGGPAQPPNLALGAAHAVRVNYS